MANDVKDDSEDFGWFGMILLFDEVLRGVDLEFLFPMCVESSMSGIYTEMIRLYSCFVKVQTCTWIGHGPIPVLEASEASWLSFSVWDLWRLHALHGSLGWACIKQLNSVRMNSRSCNGRIYYNLSISIRILFHMLHVWNQYTHIWDIWGGYMLLNLP